MFETLKPGFGLPPSQLLLLGIGIPSAIFLCAYFGVLDYVCVAALIGAAGLQFAYARQRTRQIEEIARNHGLAFTGGTLTNSFPLHKTSSRSAHAIRNAVAGYKNGRQILVFDCRLGRGKGSCSRTVVPVRGDETAFGWTRFGPDMGTERAGDWAVVYGARRELTLREIEEILLEAAKPPSESGN